MRKSEWNVTFLNLIIVLGFVLFLNFVFPIQQPEVVLQEQEEQIPKEEFVPEVQDPSPSQPNVTPVYPRPVENRP